MLQMCIHYFLLTFNSYYSLSRLFLKPFITSNKGGGKCFARVCLSVCLSVSEITQKRVDLDEMLRVDRCRVMDELINC